MAEKTTNYQCPACTGPLHYDGASGKLVCDYCGSAYDVKAVSYTHLTLPTIRLV